MALFEDDPALFWSPFPDNLLDQTSSTFVYPKRTWTSSLTGGDIVPIAASKLTYHRHFDSKPIGDEEWCDLVTKMTAYYNSVAVKYNDPEKVLGIPETAPAMSRKFYLLEKQKIRSEAELRYAICDPLMELLCKTWGLKVRLEESAKTSDESTEQGLLQQSSLTQTPTSQGVYKSVSRDVRPDYTCYYMFGNTGENAGRAVAVVIEAKLTTNSMHKNVVPQAIGYYVTLRSTSQHKPPIAIIITEIGVQILLFPFRDPQSGDGLVNAIALNTMCVWESESCLKKIDQRLLEFLVLMVCPCETMIMETMNLPKGMNVVKKISLQQFIITAQQEMEKTIEDLLRQLAENQEQLAEKDKENQQQLAEKDKKIAEKDKKIRDLLKLKAPDSGVVDMTKRQKRRKHNSED